MTREEYLKKAQAESAALLAKLEAETLATIEAENKTASQTPATIEYIPDGGGAPRRTRSGRALLDFE